MTLQLLDSLLDGNKHCNKHCNKHINTCSGTSCFVLSRLIPGTVVTLVGDSGTSYGPATFVKFEEYDCAAIVRIPAAPGSPVTVVDCTKVESIVFNF